MIVALLNQKGGVGKTTLATHIAGELAMRGQSVILEARAIHLWHPTVGSKPQSISTSPNMAYFKREMENVPAYCVEGLNIKRVNY